MQILSSATAVHWQLFDYSRAAALRVLGILFFASVLFSHQRLAGQQPPHVVVIGGDAEYGSRETTANIAERLRSEFGMRTTLIHSMVGVLEGSSSPDKSIPNLEVIKDADLLIIFVRMRIPPQQQLDLLHEYFEAGKPAIGMRTTTHGFTNDRGWCPRYFGGHYWSHLGNRIELFTLPSQDEHPILRGVPRHARQTANGVYMTNPLADTSTPLVLAKRSNDTPAETYAWVNEYKPGSRQFFFTAGHPAEFREPHNEALLYNAVFWCLKKEIPAGGVITAHRSVQRKPLDAKRSYPSPTSRTPPADATVLFRGDDLEAWDWWFGGKEPRTFELDGRAHSGAGLPDFEGGRWSLQDGAMVAALGFGDVVSRREFSDYQLELDFLVPHSPSDTERLWRGNSGVYLNGRYEIQILDSASESSLDELSCGAITGQKAPDANACRAAGQWQHFNIVFRAPRFSGGQKVSPARVTVQLNGQTIHENVAIPRPTEWGFPENIRHGPLTGPVRLEADTAPVRFANVWLRPLSSDEVAAQLPNQRELTGKPWIDMDYGPYTTLSLEVTPENIANKGIAVRLDSGSGGVTAGHEFALFETDTLRYAAGWVGPRFIDYRGIALNGEHEAHPSLVGSRVVSNPDAPGWARPGTDDFSDDRVLGRDGKRYGPLDRSWAHWQGVYVHGDRVVFSYNVGETEVLEMPGSEPGFGAPVLTRSFQLGTRPEDLVLQVAHGKRESAELHLVTDQFTSANDQVVAIQRPELQTRIGRADDDPNEEEDEEENEDEHEAEELNEDAEQQEDPDQFEPGSLEFSGERAYEIEKSGDFDMTSSDYTIFARIITDEDGTIFSKAPANGPWVENGKSFFVGEGSLMFDIGWVGAVESEAHVGDGEWYNVAMTFEHETGFVKFYVDGELDSTHRLKPRESVENHVAKIGYTSPDFPEQGSPFIGDMRDVTFYSRALNADEIDQLGKGQRPEGELVAHWTSHSTAGKTLKDETGNGHDAIAVEVERRVFEEDEEDDEWTSDGHGRGRDASPSVTLCGVVGLPVDARWIVTDDGNVRLRIPAGDDVLRFTVLYSQSAETGEIAPTAAALSEAHLVQDLQNYCEGGRRRWDQEITTKSATLGPTDGAFVAESVTTPLENPYRSWMRLGGFDFLDEDRAAVCTWQGDVWIVSGLAEKPGEFTWQRIAAGMFQPLGLKIVDGEIYVTCRDQITVLRDLNSDGETDFYENFNNDAQVTEHFHEFAMDLQTDGDGNFYYCKAARHARDALVPQHGTLLKVSKDGSTTEIVANGFRAPNGVCVNSDGSFIVSDQEGHWCPKNRINWVHAGGFYGNMMGYHEGRNRDDFEPPVVWIHNDYDRSPAEQLWITPDRWGPIQGKLLNLSYGTGKIHLVIQEQVGSVRQGGLVRLPIAEFPTGVMRGRFQPGDGQLYVCGLFGWSSDKTLSGGFYRIRYTGKPLHLPLELRACRNGMLLTFSSPLDRASAGNWRNYAVGRWNYRRTAQYGSEDYLVSNQRRRGRDRVRVERALVSADGRQVLLEIPDMQPSMQMEIRYRLTAEDGTQLDETVHNTIHAVGDAANLALTRTQ